MPILLLRSYKMPMVLTILFNISSLSHFSGLMNFFNHLDEACSKKSFNYLIGSAIFFSMSALSRLFFIFFSVVAKTYTVGKYGLSRILTFISYLRRLVIPSLNGV